jgi:hypothetical protein
MPALRLPGLAKVESKGGVNVYSKEIKVVMENLILCILQRAVKPGNNINAVLIVFLTAVTET